MSTAKEHMIRFVEGMPEDVTFEELEKKIFKEIQYRRHIRQLVEESRKDLAEGRTYSRAEAAKILGFE